MPRCLTRDTDHHRLLIQLQPANTQETRQTYLAQRSQTFYRLFCLSTLPIISSANTINLSGENIPITLHWEWLAGYISVIPSSFSCCEIPLLIKTPVIIVPVPGSQIRLN